jgi:excisionase family DNA binding protein
MSVATASTPERQMLLPREAAAVLGISVQSPYQRIAEGSVPTMRVGCQYRNRQGVAGARATPPQRR